MQKDETSIVQVKLDIETLKFEVQEKKVKDWLEYDELNEKLNVAMLHAQEQYRNIMNIPDTMFLDQKKMFIPLSWKSSFFATFKKSDIEIMQLVLAAIIHYHAHVPEILKWEGKDEYMIISKGYQA